MSHSHHDRRAARCYRHRRDGSRTPGQYLTKSGKAVETAGDIDTVLLDKTGTITMGNRHATSFLRCKYYTENDVGRLAAWCRSPSETPEGKTIVALYKQQSGSQDLINTRDLRVVPFTAQLA